MGKVHGSQAQAAAADQARHAASVWHHCTFLRKQGECVTRPTYATVEQLQAATDAKTTAFEQARLRRLLESAADQIDKRMHRHFYPLTEIRTYHLDGGGEGFWLHQWSSAMGLEEIVSLTQQ